MGTLEVTHAHNKRKMFALMRARIQKESQAQPPKAEGSRKRAVSLKVRVHKRHCAKKLGVAAQPSAFLQPRACALARRIAPSLLM